MGRAYHLTRGDTPKRPSQFPFPPRSIRRAGQGGSPTESRQARPGAVSSNRVREALALMGSNGQWQANGPHANVLQVFGHPDRGATGAQTEPRAGPQVLKFRRPSRPMLGCYGYAGRPSPGRPPSMPAARPPPGLLEPTLCDPSMAMGPRKCHGYLATTSAPLLRSPGVWQSKKPCGYHQRIRPSHEEDQYERARQPNAATHAAPEHNRVHGSNDIARQTQTIPRTIPTRRAALCDGKPENPIAACIRINSGRHCYLYHNPPAQNYGGPDPSMRPSPAFGKQQLPSSRPLAFFFFLCLFFATETPAPNDRWTKSCGCRTEGHARLVVCHGGEQTPCGGTPPPAFIPLPGVDVFRGARRISTLLMEEPAPAIPDDPYDEVLPGRPHLGLNPCTGLAPQLEVHV